VKKLATTLLAGLMLVGTVSALTSSKAPKIGFSDGGPAPLCWPSSPNCPPPIPTAK
jgi:hypothetical protein